jgi:hypothetical protein
MLVVQKDQKFRDRMARTYAADPMKEMGASERTLNRTGHLMHTSNHFGSEIVDREEQGCVNLRVSATETNEVTPMNGKPSKKTVSFLKALRLSGVFLILSLHFTSAAVTVMDEARVLARGFSQIWNDPKYKAYLNGTWTLPKPESHVPKSPL